MENKFNIKQIEQIADSIKSDDSWVNDSHTSAEYRGLCEGLQDLISQLKKIN